MFKFITHRHFFVNLLVIIALTALLIWGFLQMLGAITKHGEYLTVPNVLHKSTNESVKLLESKGFTVVIQDSTYTDTAKLGTVLKQFPEANSTVKVNRLILLTVNRVTLPMVEMPNLIGKSKEYALEILERTHLKLGDTLFKPSYMMGAVIENNYNGNIIAAGTKIPWGSSVELVIGSGLSDEQFIVPSLIGLTYSQAKQIIEDKGIMLASTIADAGTKDTANAFVYKQNPPRVNEDMSPNYIRAGQVMDLWVSPIMKAAVDSTTIEIEPNKDVKKETKNELDKIKK
ncbi:MAG: PASTA domain-containing protein [Ferruginibacter sp.]|nr:PASTA domain-containing protein [Ferruginibacter sp.]